LRCDDLGSFKVMGGVPPLPIKADSVGGQMDVHVRLVPVHNADPLVAFHGHFLNVALGDLCQRMIPRIFPIREAQGVVHDWALDTGS